MSSLFFLNIFSDGDSATSQYFHIEANGVSEGATSSSLAVTSTSLSVEELTAASTSASRGHNTPSVESGTASASTPTSGTANISTSSIAHAPDRPDQPVHQHMHNDFPLSHKIGLGIGIPATLALGILAGWLLFRRHQRKKRRVSHELPPSETRRHVDDHRTSRIIHEAPLNHVVEIGRSHGQGFEQLGGELEDKPAITPEALPMRYEMEANTVHELHEQPVKPDEPFIKKET